MTLSSLNFPHNLKELYLFGSHSWNLSYSTQYSLEELTSILVKSIFLSHYLIYLLMILLLIKGVKPFCIFLHVVMIHDVISHVNIMLFTVTLLFCWICSYSCMWFQELSKVELITMDVLPVQFNSSYSMT